MRIRDHVLALVALTLTVSCSTRGRTYEIDESIQRPSEQPLLDIARAVKEFSGYYCEDGNFVVGLVRLDAAIKQAVTDRLEPGIAAYCGATSTLVFVMKKYSFLSLRAWRDTINLEYFEIDGAVSLGIRYTE